MGRTKNYQQLLPQAANMFAYCGGDKTFQGFLAEIVRHSKANSADEITWADVEDWIKWRGEDIARDVARYGSR